LPTVLTLTERKDLCSLLVQLFSYPDAALSKRLAEPATAILSARLAVPPLSGPEIDWTTLEPAYTSLFINRLGGVPAPPYGSVYLDDDGQVMGPSALRVAQCYQQEGLVVDSPEPPDFLATELEFLFYLADLETAGERVESAHARTVFFNELFFPWITPFCQRLAAADPHPCYGWAATLLLAFCRQEKEHLSTQPFHSPAS
jgi:putative dimethyl sulfoxide reductase chaperone